MFTCLLQYFALIPPVEFNSPCVLSVFSLFFLFLLFSFMSLSLFSFVPKSYQSHTHPPHPKAPRGETCLVVFIILYTPWLFIFLLFFFPVCIGSFLSRYFFILTFKSIGDFNVLFFIFIHASTC
jgi:ABC-type Fe3+ transport system permease subunit